jgi:radical SAM protein (TIGR04043 family)
MPPCFSKRSAVADPAGLKVLLQAAGARLDLDRSDGAAGRCGGAGPADGVTIFIGEIVATVPTNAAYVSESPYVLREAGSEWALLCEGREICAVEMAAEPAFLSLSSSSGTPFKKIAARHGKDAIGSTVAQSCARGCAFCGIGLSRKSGTTQPLKTPLEIGEASAAALEEGYAHLVLTTGTTNLQDCGIEHLVRCADAAKGATGGRMKVHVQFEPPADDAWIDIAAEAADSAAINFECFDADTLLRVAPGKAATGLARYERAWKHAVAAFGPGQVTSFIIAGLGEPPDSVLKGCELLAGIGVYPFVLPLRPIPGTPMGSLRPPLAEEMGRLYGQAAEVIARSGLSAGECFAGCVACGACSAITDM